MLKAVESNKESLQQLKAVNAELERDVGRVRQRDELLRQVEFLGLLLILLGEMQFVEGFLLVVL